MTIERRNVGKRLSDLVIYAPPPGGRLVYLAGQVAEDAKADITRTDALGAGADRPPARRSGHRQDAHSVGDDLPRRHERLRGDERRLGCVGARRARRRRARPSRRGSPIPRIGSRSRSSRRPADGPAMPLSSAAQAVVAATLATRTGRDKRRRGAARHARGLRPVDGALLRAGAVHPGARRRLARLGPGRPDVHRFRERRRGHRARPLPSGDGQGARDAGAHAVARVELVHQRAGVAPREAAHRRDVRRARVLLQLRRRGERSRAEARAPLCARSLGPAAMRASSRR